MVYLADAVNEEELEGLVAEHGVEHVQIGQGHGEQIEPRGKILVGELVVLHGTAYKAIDLGDVDSQDLDGLEF